MNTTKDKRRFTVKDNTECCYALGTQVELVYDDGSDCPQVTNGSLEQWVNWKDLEEIL